MSTPLPPKWPLRIMRYFVRPEYLEEIEGDMEELFLEDLDNHSCRKARRLYAWNVLSLWRPVLLQPVSEPISNLSFIMIHHHLRFMLRSSSRSGNTFFINLVGLSTGLAGALLIFLWVGDEMKFDGFHRQDDRLFQVMQNHGDGDEIETEVYTPGLLAAALEEEFPEIERAVTVGDPLWGMDSRGVLSVENKHLKGHALYVGPQFFDLFTFPLLAGNPTTVLLEPDEVLLSDELARKLFGTTDGVIGRSLEWEQDRMSGNYTVGGVFEAPPSHSTMQFDLLFPYEIMFKEYRRLHHWGNSDPRTFVLLAAGTQSEETNRKIRNFCRTKYLATTGKDNLGDIGTIFLQRYSERYLHGQYENGKVAGGRIAYVRLFSLIAAFLLVIACINFMNLSTARATKRSKEVGIRKVVGASRSNLIAQYLGESLLFTLIAMLIAIGLVGLMLPHFNIITAKSLTLDIDRDLILGLTGIGLLTGILAGSYPALYLSRFKPVAVLKGKLPVAIGENLIRRALVVFQFGVSVILIISVIVVYRQIHYIHTKNLGYDRDNILVFSAEGKLEENQEVFLNELRQLPEVQLASGFGHDLIGDHGGTSGVNWPGRRPEQRINFGNLEVGPGLLQLLDFEIVQGRAFNREHSTDTAAIIFNQSAIAAMELTEPIGKIVKLWGKDRQIIGVVKDFHYTSLYEDIGPCFFQCQVNLDNVLVKVRMGTEQTAIARIADLYRKYNEDLAFEYRFLDEDYQQLYAAENRVAILSRYFAGMAILISSLGLFGLAAFTAERRTREIGIRKILGSNTFGIVRLLSADFTKMVVLAISIALPIGYLLARQWLHGFAYRIDLHWWLFGLAALMTLLIAWLTISLQTIRAAAANPVNCLKEE